ncbi:MAG: Acetyltransferase, GNAT family [uncultured Microvirga sp.]|uniref:Acetyltransferase, GNAT family n=1 Tax=uncultured Microvirga sp. TaxID=412392 RepID=A0A6J4KWK0_9HYPH|nr:MAG: Acetyltransferase, GNAT family [uncultured Microvirga sp.]
MRKAPAESRGFLLRGFDQTRGSVSVLVRPSIAADIPGIAAIYGHAVLYGAASFEIDQPSVAEMTRRRDAILAGGYPYLVAERAGAVAGYAYAAAYRTRPAYRFTVEDSVYVAPEAQGKGVGQALLAALIQACEARDFRLMVAVIGDRASLGSIRLHEKLGFVPVGVLEPVGYKHGRWLASVLMQRPLGPGGSLPPADQPAEA